METNKCRTCGRLLNDGDYDDCVNLFQSSQWLEKLKIFMGAKITCKGSLPVFMCAQCQQYVQQAAEFHNIYSKTQQMLKEEAASTEIPLTPAALNVEDNKHFNPHTSFIKTEYIDNENEMKVSDELKLQLFSNKNSAFRGIHVLTKHANHYDDDDDETSSDNVYKCPAPVNKRRKVKCKTVKDLPIESKEIKNQQEFMCNQCGKHFCNYTDYKDHQIIHIGLKDFKCNECNMEFYANYRLKYHKYRQHNCGGTIYVCKFCEKTFKTVKQKKRHEREFHTREQTFHCRYCPKFFVCSSFRQQHEKIHRNIRIFQCKLCDCSFKKRKILIQHYETKTHKKNLKQKQQQLSESSFY